MESESPFGKTRFSEIVLEKARIATSRILDDVPGLRIHSEIRLRPEYEDAVLELRAYVLAAKRKGEPYTMSDRIVATTPVVKRPVWDGVLYWLSCHTPGAVSRWLLKRVRWREIPLRQVVTMQQIDYYGCPHAAIDSDRDSLRVHLEWMGEQIGQSPPTRESQL